VTGRVAPGWYPDYEAPPGHQRFWDGERWTERRSAVPRRVPARRLAAWIGGGIAALVVVVTVVLLLTDDDPASPGSGSTPPPASTPGPPDASSGTESAEPTTDPDPERKSWEVSGALDDATVQLAAGPLVRLVGVSVDGDCATGALAGLVEGRLVTLTKPGADKDGEGRLLRYVDRDGVDVGLRLIQRGLATASDEPHPRGAIYRRVDDRSPDLC
jgi:uncharacterized protein DUF2510